MILFLYNTGLLLLLLAASPLLLVRPRWRAGLRERLVADTARLRLQSGAVWVHAVSVGEVMAVSRLVEELDQRLGAGAVVISTTTLTGQRLAQQRFGAERCFNFPLDLPWVLRSVMGALRPRLLLLVESELWPNLLMECERAAVPVLVANARISDRSLPRYLRLRTFWRPFLKKLTMVLAQSEEDARRFVAIGVAAERVRVGGNLKYDARLPQSSALVQQVRERLPRNARVLVAGSTLEGEEAMLLSAWARISAELPAVMVLAPRHPERFGRVAALAREQGAALVRRSAWDGSALRRGEVLLLDTIGELAAMYALADVAFVGGSLVASGGHNPLEPARFGKPVVMGPHYENFRDVVQRLRSADALRIVDCDRLADALTVLLRDAASAEAMGARGRQVFADSAGATERTLAAAMELLAKGQA